MSTKKSSRRTIKMLLMRSLCFQFLLCFLVMSAAQSQSEAVYKKPGLKPILSDESTICMEVRYNLNSAAPREGPGGWDSADVRFQFYDLSDVMFKLFQRLSPSDIPKQSAMVIGFRDESEPLGISVTRANDLKEYFTNCWKANPELISIRNYGSTCRRSGEKSLNARVIVCIPAEGKSVEGVEAFLDCSPGSTPKLLTEAPAVLQEEQPLDPNLFTCPEEWKKRRRRAPRRPETKTDEEAPPPKPAPRKPGL